MSRPLFVHRARYRRRRLSDAARLLPLLGAFLFLLPVLWSPESGQGRATAADAVYLFAVWGGLVVTAALLARRLRGDEDGAADDDD
jgi:hypothetical protein